MQLQSPLIRELDLNAKKYLDDNQLFKQVIHKYDSSFREEFLQTTYGILSKEQQKFFQDCGRFINNMDKLYTVPGELDDAFRKINNRIDDSRSLPLAARKYVEDHRHSCLDLNQYFTHYEQKFQDELDGILGLYRSCL